MLDLKQLNQSVGLIEGKQIRDNNARTDETKKNAEDIKKLIVAVNSHKIAITNLLLESTKKPEVKRSWLSKIFK